MVSMSLFDRGSSSELESTGGGGFLMRTACCGFDGSFLGRPRRSGVGWAGSEAGSGVGVGSGVGSGAGSGGVDGAVDGVRRVSSSVCAGSGRSATGCSTGSNVTIF